MTEVIHPGTVLQVLRHGSATGVDLATLTGIHPQVAVITFGKDNRYRLPNEKVLSFLNQAQIPYERTDQHGDIEFISDGQIWEEK